MTVSNDESESRQERRLKPLALLQLYSTAQRAFDLIKGAFLGGVDAYQFDITDVDSMGLDSFKNPPDVAAFALRKLQSLRWNSQSEVYTTNALVIRLCEDISEAIGQLREVVAEELADPIGGAEEEAIHDWIREIDVARNEIVSAFYAVGELGKWPILLVGNEQPEEGAHRPDEEEDDSGEGETFHPTVIK